MPRPLFVVLVATAILLLAGRMAITVRDADISDFRCFYEAGRVVREGLDPYDREIWAAATRSDPQRLPPCDATFIYPAWTAVAMSPISLLPEPVALAAWEIFALACVLLGVAFTASVVEAPVGAALLVLALWSEPVYSALANAQFGALLFFAIAAMTLALVRRREVGAVFAWCVLLLKPHVIALALVGTVVARRARPFAVFAVGAAIIIALVSLAILPSWPREVLVEAVSQRRLDDAGLDTFWGFAAATGLPSSLAIVAALASCAAMAALIPRRTLALPELVAVLVPASLLVVPYARTHDHVMLALPWGVVLGLASAAPPIPRRVLLFAVVLLAFALPWTLTILSYAGVPNGMRVLVPLASGLLAAAALRVARMTDATREPLG